MEIHPQETAAAPEDSRTIKVQVGQRTFLIPLSLAEKYPDAFLWKAYQFRGETTFSFPERDEAVFESLVRFYKTGVLHPPPNTSWTFIAKEVDHWGFSFEARPCPLPEDSLAFRLSYLTKMPLSLPKKNTSPSSTLMMPLGVSLRRTSECSDVLLRCLCWNAMTRSSAVWAAATLGHREIRFYWPVGLNGMLDVSLVLSDMGFMERLAELSGCTLRHLGQVHMSSIDMSSRRHDVITTGTLSFDSPSRTIHAVDLMGEARLSDTILLFSFEDKVTEFEHKGYVIRIKIEGERLWWSIRLKEWEGFDDVVPDQLEDIQGFLIHLKVVWRNSIYPVGFLPSCSTTSMSTSTDHFLAVLHDPPKDTPASVWAHSDRRESFLAETFVVDNLGIETCKPEPMTILLEEYTDITLMTTDSFMYRPCVRGDMGEILSLSWKAPATIR